MNIIIREKLSFIKNIFLGLFLIFIIGFILLGLMKGTWIEENGKTTGDPQSFHFNNQCYIEYDYYNWDKSKYVNETRFFSAPKTVEECQCAFEWLDLYAIEVGVLPLDNDQWDLHIGKRILFINTTENFAEFFKRKCL